jgi:cell division protease FtsH
VTDVAAIVDDETKKLLATAHQEAFDILEENRDVLDSLVLELLEKETLSKHEVAEIFVPLRRRDPRPAWTGSDTRRPSDRPAVEIPRWIVERDKENLAKAIRAAGRQSGVQSGNQPANGVDLAKPSEAGSSEGSPPA